MQQNNNTGIIIGNHSKQANEHKPRITKNNYSYNNRKSNSKNKPNKMPYFIETQNKQY